MWSSGSVYVHSFDPGETTGYCYAECNWENLKPRLVRVRTFGCVHDLGLWYRGYSPNLLGVPEIVLIEKWRLFPGYKGHDQGADSLIYNEMPAAVVRGQIEMVASLLMLDVVYQKPSDMKPFATVEVLSSRIAMGSLGMPRSEHIRDALRHLAYFFYSTKEKAKR